MRPSRLGRFAVLFGAACAITLAIAGPAQAATTTTGIHLNTRQQGKTAAAFEDGCDQVPGGRVNGIDGWVFVLPGNQGTLVSLHLTFNDGTKNVTVDIPGTSYPNGISASGSDKMYVKLPAGWKIVDGTGTATNPKKDFFNVTHVCRSGGKGGGNGGNGGGNGGNGGGNGSGGGTNGGSGSSSGSGSGGASGGNQSESLPITGTAIGGLVALGLGLVAAGSALLVVRRRRQVVDFQA
jgi:LPXTG-motif cell wall-anchored protein